MEPRFRRFLPGALVLALLACSPADDAPPEIDVRNGWARETAPGQSAAAVYLTITNKGDGEDRLVDVQTGAAQATLHATSNAGGIARMRSLAEGVVIAPQSQAELKPGGTHIMVTGLNKRLSPGATIGLTLDFERSGKRPVAIRVVPAGSDGHSSHGMSM